MKSTAYYVPLYPKYRSIGNVDESKQNSSPIQQSLVPTNGPTVSEGSFDLFLIGKLQVVEASIEHVMEEIQTREVLRDKLVQEIDQASCRQRELLMQTAPHGSSTFTVGDSRRRAGIEKELAALDVERRREFTSAWKDVAQLKKELRTLLREYEEEKRRERVMTV